MAKASFKYQRRSADDVKTRINMRTGGFDTIILPQYKFYKLKDGKNMVRILPRTWELKKGEQDHYGLDLWVNYGIGIDNQSYLSLSKMLGKPDPISEAKFEAERQGDEKLARALQARRRVLVWMVDRMAEDEGPQIWSIPISVDKDFNTISRDEDTNAVVYVDDPEEGADIRFYKEGSGIGTKYPPARMKLQQQSPIHEDQAIQDEWCEYIAANPLPDCLQYFSYEHIQLVFGGQARVERNDEDKDDVEETPRTGRRRAAAVVEEDEDEAPRARSVRRPPVDEDEKPAPRRHAAAAKVEDEEEFDDETGEITPPKKAAKGNGKKAHPDEDETPTANIRERLARRRSAQPAADDD